MVNETPRPKLDILKLTNKQTETEIGEVNTATNNNNGNNTGNYNIRIKNKSGIGKTHLYSQC